MDLHLIYRGSCWDRYPPSHSCLKSMPARPDPNRKLGKRVYNRLIYWYYHGGLPPPPTPQKSKLLFMTNDFIPIHKLPMVTYCKVRMVIYDAEGIYLEKNRIVFKDNKKIHIMSIDFIDYIEGISERSYENFLYTNRNSNRFKYTFKNDNDDVLEYFESRMHI